MRDTKRDDRESAARGPRGFAVLLALVLVAACVFFVALLAFVESGLEDQTPLVDLKR